MIRFYGNSITGKKHLDAGQPNQDYCLVKNARSYSCAVVCDGLGSKPFSHYGSHYLCKIIINNARLLTKGKTGLAEFIETVTKIWRKKTDRRGTSNCDTTCLFCVTTKEEIICGQIGDGMIAFCKDDKSFTMHLKDDDFINETSSIAKSQFKDWTVCRIETRNADRIFMTTDGISNDVVNDVLPAFVAELSDCVRKSFLKNKNKDILDILRQMPNKYNIDDKTIVLGRNE